jgi:hypothetical protein
LLARNGPVDGVDQRLGLDEFDPCPLGLVAIEGRSEDFCKSVAVIGHPLARLFQRFKSLAHLGFAFCWPRVLIGAEGIAAIVFFYGLAVQEPNTPMAIGSRVAFLSFC